MDKYCEKKNDGYLCFPFRMQDGRALTDYRSSRVIYNEMTKKLCNNNKECCNSNNTHNVSLCMQRNTDFLMDNTH